ncbi:MAG: class I SAM-dependent methyltransferase [Halocynthiibacter sp.]
MVTKKKTTVLRGKPKGDSYYDDVARNYEVKRQKQAWWHVEQDEMQDLLSKLPDNLSVVDIPFGTGRFVPMYKEKGFTVSGLDASGDMISTAKKILGEDFTGVDARVGDAAALPFKDQEFDLLVSTRFLRDIVVYSVAKKILREFSRVTKQYAIIQLGHNREEGFIPDEDTPMGGSLSEKDTYKLLKDNRFEVIEKRLVLRHDEEGTDIYHFLCKKI